MGVYLSTPVVEKHSSDCGNSKLKCGSSSMQGWRYSQEDAHNCCLDFDGDISLFAVYDGHGGHEVAKYASQALPDFLKSLDAYKEGELEVALRDSFLGFDATLKEEEIAEKLKKIANEDKTKPDSNDLDQSDDCLVEEDQNDLENLKNDADLPLTEVLFANYTGIIKTPAVKRLNLGESSKSPFLRGKTTSSTDVEVSSSSSQSKDVVTNGVSEPNGVEGSDLSESASAGNSEVSSSSIVPNGDPVDSTSADKPEESAEAETTSTASKEEKDSGQGCVSSTESGKEERMSKKKAVQMVFSSLLAQYDSSDSDDSDSSFKTGDPLASSDEDESEKVNGSKLIDDDLEEADDEESEEDEDEDEDEDDNRTEEPGVDSGCTAVVALVTKDKLYVANAGDSRAVLSRNGKAVDMSEDHKPEDEIELKRIKAAGGVVNPDGRVNGGLNLSRALGDHFYKRSAELDAKEQMITALPDVKIEKITPEDEFVILACDGIWNSMSSQEVVDFVRPLIAQGEKLSSICEKLFDKCLAPNTAGDGTGCDNMTCVLVQFVSNQIKIPDKEAQTQESLKRTLDESQEEEVDNTVTQSVKKHRVD